ncbi:MAG TPA: hypothetical protein VGB24_18560 [Longimicrobium sp.]|jgi:hypothetical protein|uniref:hypothetical protein n=1 Tax=Longimicrobium sp. TaxID=2029185 RepID=UPI002ED9E46F
MATTTNVYLFNGAESGAYQLMINGGNKVTVPATAGDSVNWVPGTSTSPATLLTDGTTAEGQFNFNANQVQVQHPNSTTISSISINIPDTPGVNIDACQLYVFFTNYVNPPTWLFLVNGFVVAGTASA